MLLTKALPTRDRDIQRGLVLTTAAGWSLLAPISDSPDLTLGLLFVFAVIFAAMARWLPAALASIVGLVGGLTAVARVLNGGCGGSLTAGDQLAILGVAAAAAALMLSARLLTPWSLVRSGSLVALHLFALVELSEFIVAPAGLNIWAPSVASVAPAAVLVLALGLIVTAGVAVMPEFTTSVLGVGLAFAYLLLDSAGSACLGDPGLAIAWAVFVGGTYLGLRRVL